MYCSFLVGSKTKVSLSNAIYFIFFDVLCSETEPEVVKNLWFACSEGN